MSLMRLRLIEQVAVKKIPHKRFLAKEKVWGDYVPYLLFFEQTPYDSAVSEVIVICSCDLIFASDTSKKEETHYWYTMEEEDRLEADARLKQFFADLDKQGWNIFDFAKQMIDFFDTPKSYWLYSYSPLTREIIEQTDEFEVNDVKADVLLQRKG